MNKSLATNITAVFIIVIGYISPCCRDLILSAGFFALSGAVTNWLAVYMLFEKVPLLYGSGVIPLHFREFKTGIRSLIMTEFFTRENLEKFFSDPGSSMLVEINIDEALEEVDFDGAFNTFTSIILKSQFGGMLGMFGGASVLEGFREPFKEKLKAFVKEETSKPGFKEAVANSLEAGNMSEKIETQVEGIIDKRLDELTPQMVKKIIQDMIRKHLGWLVVWGGVFGGVIGLVMGIIRT